MRFTAIRDLPESEYIESERDTEEFCSYLESSDHLIGFDTETSGLEQDGLGVRMFVVCLATQERRAAIIMTPNNSRQVLQCLERTQDRHCGFNIIYDWNAVYGHSRYVMKMRNPVHLTRCWADGMKLWCHFDEEGEETYGNRGLKYRARHYIGLPMNNFDKVIESGDIMEGFKTDFARTLDYCTRDAWAHLGICLLGRQLTEQMPWGVTCEHCGHLCFQYNEDSGKWFCPDHGYVHGAESTSMWDWSYNLDNPYLSVLQKMQVRGLPINWGYLETAIEPLQTSIANYMKAFQEEISAALKKEGGEPWEVNPNSTQQLQRLYHRRLENGKVVGFGYPVQGRTDGGDASMADDHLKKLVVHYNAPGVLTLLKIREQKKILSTYVEGMIKRKFAETGRIHGSFRPVTTTGRLRSRDPNMQNFPTKDIIIVIPPVSPWIPGVEELMDAWEVDEETAAEELKNPEYNPTEIRLNIRAAISAPEGMLLCCADYAQLELRLAAIESQCPKMIAAINDGLDLHCYAAARAFEHGLGGMTYDDLNEMKCWGDHDFEPRLKTARRVLSLDDADVQSFLVLRTSHPDKLAGEKNALVRDGLELVEVLRASGWDGNLDDEVFQRFAAVIGTRDKELKGLRSSAKSAIFGIIYGIGATRLAYQITETTGRLCSLDEAKELISSVTDDVFDGLGKMIRRLQGTVREMGYIRTLMGRYRHPAGIDSGNDGKRAQALRQSQNSPIQGLAADVVQKAMLAIDTDPEMNRLSAFMINQVHDEILVEVPERNAEEALQRMRFLMETAHGIDSPVRLETSGKVGRTWDDAK